MSSLKISTPKFLKTRKYLKKIEEVDFYPILERHARMGVIALSNATPVDSGETSQSWAYHIEKNQNGVYKIKWTNSVLAGDVPLVLLLQYGHATKSGRFISGRDFINPALYPVYDSLNRALIKEVLP